MASSPAEEIKEKLNIVEFLKGYLTLQQAGKNFKANCPFHKEKTPSFMISPERQSWHCFGCGIGGDVFSFVMRFENVEFGDALRILADKAGIELKRLNPAEYKFTGVLFDLNNIAKEFFKEELRRSEEAKEYLKGRKLTGETAQEFELGWAPNDMEKLTMKLLHSGFRPEEVIQAGLSFKTERGMQMDRFRGRIMFPIHNHHGKVVGFTGRILPRLDNGQTGKYMNSPETAIFNKSKLLYGFWKTKSAVRDEGSAFLVEGQMDFLMSYQAGIKNVVASSGTALTQDHLQTIKRLADKLILSFDTDEAGMTAGERAIDLAEANDFQVRIANLPEGCKDPADVVVKGPELLKEIIEKARPAQEFYFDRYLPKGQTDIRDSSFLKRLRTVLNKLKMIPSPVEQSFWVKELEKRTGIEDKTLREEMSRMESRDPGIIRTALEEPEAEIATRNLTRRDLLSQRLLSAMINQNKFDLLGERETCLPVQYFKILNTLRAGGRKMEDPALDEVLDLIILRSEEIGEEELFEMRDHLYKEYLKERRSELIDTIKRAEVAGDEKMQEAALRELSELPSF